jgi:Chlorophyllase enzyme
MKSIHFARKTLAMALPIAALSGSALAGCSDGAGDIDPARRRPGDPTGGSSGSAGAGAVSGSGGVTGGSSGTNATGGTVGGSSGASGGIGGTVGGSSGTSGGGAIGGRAGTGGTGGTAGGGSFPPVTDFAAPGPFAVTQTTGGPSCTIHRPTDEALGGPGKNLKHPVITWGNGTGATPAAYQAVLRHWATHGFIVTAANSTSTGDAVEMIACLEWILEQNAASGPYMGRVESGKLGASGHSQGGGGTLMTGRDVRITATAPLQPYILGGLGGFQRASIAAQQGPMFLMSGSEDTIATPSANQQPVFEETNVPVLWGILQGATHTGTAVGNLGGYRGPSTAWFRLHLMGDESARSLFYGASCGLCGDSSWTVQRKLIQ